MCKKNVKPFVIIIFLIMFVVMMIGIFSTKNNVGAYSDMVMTKCVLYNKNGDIVDSDLYVYKLNRYQDIETVINYDNAGDVKYSEVYLYDIDQNLIEKYKYYKNSFIIDTYTKYDDHGNEVSITTYNTNNSDEEILSSDEYAYLYDGDNRLVQIDHSYDFNSGNSCFLNETTKYGYDLNGKLISKVLQGSDLYQDDRSDYTVITEYSYNEEGKLDSAMSENTSLYYSNKEKQESAAGVTMQSNTHIYYSNEEKPVLEIIYDDANIVSETVKYEYDDRGNMISELHYDKNDVLRWGTITEYNQYNLANKVISISEGEQWVAREYEYDSIYSFQ